ncbi:hypothetical protein MNBD_UNCLBAC01-515 [hydrothermal vent metagenome]|uniref:O-antigen polymerase n=1 Tax=hydrothermal vent metagenome TaxID=652676 RepID=A0A3B1DUX3_9ZZZZ
MLNKKTYLLDSAGLISIGILSLGYILFYSTFAEYHIQLSFLNFPIFVGEIILSLCVVLFFSKCLIQTSFNKYYFLVIGYFVFVLIKAFLGYLEFGPLAFRNAALLYYPFFAILGFSFYRRDFFEQKKIFLLSLLIIGVFFTHKFSTYWTLTLFFSALILIKSYHQKFIKYGLLIGFLVVVPYLSFIRTSRMMMVGNFVASIYIIFSFYNLLNWKKEVKRVGIVLIFFSFIFGIINFGDVNAMKSIVSFDKMSEIFNFYDQKIDKVLKEGNYKSVKLNKVGLYNSNVFKEVEDIKKSGDRVVINLKKRAKQVDIQKEVDVVGDFQEKGFEAAVKKEKVETVRILKESLNGEVKKDIVQNNIQEEKIPQRNWEGACINAVFRMFIWRDMVVEFVNKKPFLGFHFGKPLRSRSLEILNWGGIEWTRDGWIGAHNSYLHIIYRSGIVGIIFIISILTILFKMIKTFIQLKSVTGILLCGIIINWFVAANFLLIFELPYTAIPIWTIYGMTFAYYRGLKVKSLDHSGSPIKAFGDDKS